MVRTSILSAVPTPSVEAKVSAMIKPNRTSGNAATGSRIGYDDFAESGASAFTAVVIRLVFQSVSQTSIRQRLVGANSL